MITLFNRISFDTISILCKWVICSLHTILAVALLLISPLILAAPPTITGTPPTTAKVGWTYSFTPTAEDVDGDTLEFSINKELTELKGLNFDTSTGTLSGTPTEDGVINDIEISVYDSMATTTLAFDLTVINVTRPYVSSTVAVEKGPSAIAINHQTNQIYVVNELSDTVTVIDGNNPNLTTTVAVGSRPIDLAINSNTNQIYVVNQESNNVTVIDGNTLNTTTIAVGILGYDNSLTVNSQTNKIYVANERSNNVTVIDGNTLNTTTVTVGNSPTDIAINPNTNLIYVANYSSNNVTVIDGNTLDTTTIAVGNNPGAIAINPNTNQIYVANYYGHNVTVIDGDTLNTTTVAEAEFPEKLTINTNTNQIYVYYRDYNGNYPDRITMIDGNTLQTNTVETEYGYGAMAINPNTNQLYVTMGDKVMVIDGNHPNLTTTTTVAVEGYPQNMAINPQTNQIYVVSKSSSVTVTEGINIVTIIDGGTFQVNTIETEYGLDVIAINPNTNQTYVGVSEGMMAIDNNTLNTTTVGLEVGFYPAAIAINPNTNHIYVAASKSNEGSNVSNVTVIDSSTLSTTTIIDTVGDEPTALAINPKTNQIYMASFFYEDWENSLEISDNVTVIDGNTLNTNTITVGKYPIALAINPNTNKIYVANRDSGNVTVIDGNTLNTTTVALEDYPEAIAINSKTNQIYVAGGESSKNVIVIDGNTLQTTIVKVGLGPIAITINQNTNQIYVASENATVTVIDGYTLNATTVAMEQESSAIAINQKTNQIYVTNVDYLATGLVTVIDGYTLNTTTIVLPVLGGTPYVIAINPNTNQIYVPNTTNHGDNVAVITPLENTHPNPFPVEITALADDTASLSTPTFSFNATGNNIAQIYYQTSMGIDKSWQRATLTGDQWQGTTFTLPRGGHFIRAFATDEVMEATLNNAVGTNSPFIGEISTYFFRVIPSPIALDKSGNTELTTIDEDTENTGTLISDMLATGANGDPIADGDYDAVEGIAITAVDNTNGSWEYSINSGSTWTAFGNPSETEARLLIDEPNTRIRFLPNANYNGIIENGITFRAWEQLTGGGVNGSTIDITKVSEAEREAWLENPDGLIDPYALSPETETASITVTDTPEQFTNLYLETSATSILSTDSFEITGKLSVFPETGEDLSGHKIILTITLPDGEIQELKETITNTDTGQFKFESKDLPTLPALFSTQDGAFGFQASFAGSAHFAESKSTTEAVLVGASAGYAILVHGKLKNEEGLAAHKKTTNRIYKTLLKRRFEAANIHYFNYNIPNSDVLNKVIIGDKTTNIVEKKPTKAGIQAALTSIQTSMATTPAPLYIIMIDHGGFDGDFHIYSDNGDTNDDVILPTELAGWLTDFEADLKTKNASALKKPRIAILGYCYSGSFIADLSQKPTFSNPDDPTSPVVDAGRIIITSATAQEESYKGPDEPDGVRSGEFFMEEFFARLNSGDNLKQAFEFATEKTEIFTRRGGDSNATNRFYDDATQHPLLDDDGDGKGSNSLSADSDGHQAETVLLGINLDTNTNSAENPAEILSVSKTIYLSASEEKASLEAMVNDGDSVAVAPVDIRKPTTVLSSSGTETSEQLEIPELSRVYMTCSGALDACTGEFDQFVEPGMYEAFYFVRDNETLDISPLKRSVIYKNYEGNTAPKSFELKFPDVNGKDSEGKEPKTTLLFVWQPSLDADGPVTYNFILATDENFSNIVYQQEELETAMTYLDETVGLTDNNVSADDDNPEDDPPPYYWKVEAVDPFGERTTSTPFAFKTNNTNAPPGIGSLHISSALDFKAIGGAKITLLDESGIPLPDPDMYEEQGDYNMLLPHGRRRAKIKVAGYEEQEVEIDTSQGTAQLNVEMIPEGGMPIQPGQLQFATSVTSIDETAWMAKILVERAGGSDEAISVDYTTTSGTATNGSDYINTSGTLNWIAKDERAKAIELTIKDDLDFEDDETLTITLSNPTGGTATYPATLGNPTQITITIVDDEAAPEPVPGTLQFSASSYSATEGDTTLNLTVERTGGSDGEISVQYIISGTAIAGSDYTGEAGTLTWNDGNSTAKSLNISLIDDDEVEASESLSLTLFNPTGNATLGTLAQATLSIADNDEAGVAGTLQFAVASYTVNEGDSSTISVTRTGGSDGAVSVQYLATGDSTAIANSDYVNASGTLTWADGESSTKSFTINTSDDSEVEETETLKLMLFSPTVSASLGSPAQTTINITDNDVAPPEEPTPVTTPEPATTSNPVTTSEPVTTLEPVTNPTTTPEPVTTPNPVTTSSPVTTPNPVTTPKPVTTPSPVTTPNPVTTPSPVTTPNPVITSPTGVSGTSEAGTLQFASTTYIANESDGEFSAITVTRTGNSQGNVSIQYFASANGTAISGVDYTGGFGTLTWADGEMQPKVLPLTILADDESESLETVNFMLFNPTGQPSLGAQTQTTLIIVDDDTLVPENSPMAVNPATVENSSIMVNSGTGTLQFSASFYPASEDMGILTTVNVIRSGGSEGEVSVQYTILDNGTAAFNFDYIGGAGKLIWADGDSSTKFIPVMLLDDQQLEDLKTIPLMLSEPTGGASIGAPDRATVVIVDNDGQPEIPPQVESEFTPSQQEPTSGSSPDKGKTTIASLPNASEYTLPSLGRGIAVAKDGNILNANVLEELTGITVAFRGGVSVGGSQAYHSKLTTTPSQMVKIRGEIDIADAHVGQKADILIVAGVLDGVSGAVSQFLMLDSQAQLQVWDGGFATLVGSEVVLSQTQTFKIYHGFIEPVRVQIYFGYRLQKNGSIYFNGEQPIELQIGSEDNSSQETQEQQLVWHTEFSPNGEQIVSASSTGHVSLWDANSGHRLARLTGHTAKVKSAVFSADSKWLVTSSHDKTARLWNINTKQEVMVFSGHERALEYATFSPNAQRILTVSADKTARLWDVNSGETLFILEGHNQGVQYATFSHDGKRIVTASWDHTARLWDVETGEEIAVLVGHTNMVEHTAFSPNDQYIVTASWDKTARLWDAYTGQEILALAGHRNGVAYATFSPDGEYIVTTSWDNTVRLWSARNGKSLWERKHQAGVHHAAFSPDSQIVVTGSNDGTVRLWETMTGKPIKTLKGHEGNVWQVGFSPDGKRVISASWDNTVRVWEVESGNVVMVLND